MRIFYLVPSEDRPSWGMGIIYHHVDILCKRGFNSYIIKEKNFFVPTWLNLKVPIKDYGFLKKDVQKEDFLIVPEAMVGVSGLKKIICQKILFVQNVGYLFESMPRNEDHISLGFQHVFINMPHMVSVIENHVKLTYTIIPPFVAGYFFTEDLEYKKERQILIYPKFQQIDYSILRYLLVRYVAEHNKHWMKNLLKKNNWEIKELKNLSHEETAKEMRKSTFFISLNVFESLNASVTEAMAAGCVVFCYEGFGPRDYLLNGVNTLSFQNNEVYQLTEALFDQIDNYENNQDALAVMKQNGLKTAHKYSIEKTDEALTSFFSNLS
jgi:glycosyltransferase involved in cell wall biosynthesis